MSNILTVHVNEIARLEKRFEKKMNAYKDAEKRIKAKVHKAWLPSTLIQLEKIDKKMRQMDFIEKIVVSSKYPESGNITITDSSDKKWRIFWDGSKFTHQHNQRF